FTVTCSFVREGSGGEEAVSHAVPVPADALAQTPPDDYEDPPFLRRAGDDPFQSFRCKAPGDGDGEEDDDKKEPTSKRVWQWVRARGKISEKGGLRAHLSALAYVSDSYFIGTVSRIHRLWRYPVGPEDVDKLDPQVREHLERVNEWEG
ncbi:hypothetical protein PC116_g34109, partial [Phytophthora cactorum]